jgi:c-di-GMP-binding flagellar brake protein YcgR
MIFLPSRSGNTIIPVEGDPIEGYLPLNDTYYYFESVISKVFTGDVMCCSITHAMFIHELQRRAYTRLPMNYPFRFCHVPSNRNLDVSAADTGIWRKEGKLWQGVLADISAGGCAVNLEDPKLHIEVGDLLMFPVALPGMEPIKVAGRIIGWDTKIDESTGKEEKKMCHVRFIGLDDLIKDRIIKAIFAMMKKHHDSKG